MCPFVDSSIVLHNRPPIASSKTIKLEENIWYFDADENLEWNNKSFESPTLWPETSLQTYLESIEHKSNGIH